MKASDVVLDSDYIKLYDWSFHNSHGHFWLCNEVEQCPMLKLAIEKAIKKLPRYDLAGCWRVSIHQTETNKGQTISWYVQSTSKIWEPAERQETGEEPVQCTCTASNQRETEKGLIAQRAYFYLII